MSTQPVSADQWVSVTAAGTVVVANRTASLSRIILPGTYIGTVEFYDSPTAAGTTAAKEIYRVGIPLLNQYQHIDVFAQAKTGLTYVATGTPTLTFTWN